MVRSVFSPALVTPGPDATDPLGHLGTQERAVLFALAESAGKVVSRRELARRVGIADLSERRCDSLLVGVRRVLGPGCDPHRPQPRLDARARRRRGCGVDARPGELTAFALDGSNESRRRAPSMIPAGTERNPWTFVKRMTSRP